MSMCQEWIHQGYINIVQPFHANVKKSVAQQILTASTVLVVVPYNFSDINTHNQYATGVGPLIELLARHMPKATRGTSVLARTARA
jgi:hypothetical protein